MNQANDTDSAQRTLRADAKRNRDQLVAAARMAFAEFGPNVPLDEIAHRAGLGIGTLYRHFPARADIQEAVMAEHVQLLIEEADRQLRNPDPAAALEAWLWKKIVRSMEYRGVGAAVWLVIADRPPDFNDLCNVMQERSTELLARAQAAGLVRTDVTHKQLLKFANGIVLATEKSENRMEDIEQLFRVMMDGLKTQR